MSNITRRLKQDIYKDNMKILSEDQKVRILATMYDENASSCFSVKVKTNDNKEYFICASNLKF